MTRSRQIVALRTSIPTAEGYDFISFVSEHRIFGYTIAAFWRFFLLQNMALYRTFVLSTGKRAPNSEESRQWNGKGGLDAEDLVFWRVTVYGVHTTDWEPQQDHNC